MIEGSQLQQLAEESIVHAKKKGATECIIRLGCDQGLQVQTRLGKLDNLEFHNSQSAGITVYRGKASASVQTNQLTGDALCAAVDKAYKAAEYSAEDDCAGLADAKDIATEFKDLKLNHPAEISPDTAIELAKECEQTGLDSDKRIVNSEGSDFSTSSSIDCLAMSNGFNHYEQSTSYSLGCALIGQGAEQQQVGYWYDTNIQFPALDNPTNVGEKAARNTLQKLDAKSLHPGKFPVLFDPQMARGYWRMLLSAIRGEVIYRKTSCLNGALEQQLFPQWLNLKEQPHLLSRPGSSNYDSEGVATNEKSIIDNGKLTTYLLNSYSARKLKLRTTGNAGGTGNITITGKEKTFNDLCKSMNKGFIVREVMGNGLNLVTGDFSIGASGHWVESGEIIHAVQVVTISGNIKEMFSSIEYLGNDHDYRSSLVTGSVLLSHMTIGGDK